MIPLIIQDQFYTVQNLQRSLILQTSNWSGTFFAVSYSKPAPGKVELFSLPQIQDFQLLGKVFIHLDRLSGVQCSDVSLLSSAAHWSGISQRSPVSWSKMDFALCCEKSSPLNSVCTSGSCVGYETSQDRFLAV